MLESTADVTRLMGKANVVSQVGDGSQTWTYTAEDAQGSAAKRTGFMALGHAAAGLLPLGPVGSAAVAVGSSTAGAVVSEPRTVLVTTVRFDAQGVVTSVESVKTTTQ